ncbi:MAG: AAA domain-containing protein [Eubacteriales bacterium]|nr:AAA domain-containing protein [Eubacteriales bacterium]
MQQVAVNLAIGYDNDQLRSVNGPPGTGKTTLLKDIFAELVVQQARDIVELADKSIKGSGETKYYGNASIGVLPRKIVEKGIVVASSNNGAVQNIVNELPLLSGIDEEFIDAIHEADYFRNLSNAKLDSKWTEDDEGVKSEELIMEAAAGPDRFWGLFSLEGGKKENVNKIITALKHIVKYLEEEYEPDSRAYDEFRKKHEEICKYRKSRQESVCEIDKLHELKERLLDRSKHYPVESDNRKEQVDADREKFNEEIQSLQNEIAGLNEAKIKRQKLAGNVRVEINGTNQLIEALRLQKPGLFQFCRKKEYNQKMKMYSDKLQEILQSEQKLVNEIAEIEIKIEKDNRSVERYKKNILQEDEKYRIWKLKKEEELESYKKEISLLEKKVLAFGIPVLDFSASYETLQLSNPWFDIEYRRMQSLLFISALKVRKQFLYENRKNVKAAYIIWSKQKNYLERRKVISEAWNWINMTIPVISSTFASFSRMCAYLDKETIGYLFVDEAGQALPQASVGAMLRSRKMMVVGDPSQIKPVLTLDEGILGLLREHYGVSEKYLSENASTQTLVDAAGRYGFYKDREKEDWIGIPLWVHRRCKHPMFDIANEISYGGNMVQGVKQQGRAAWYDIIGEASDKYVAEQGLFLRERILEISRENPEVLDPSKKDVIYVISPFKNVAYELSRELQKIGFTRYDNGKPTNVGTVHTFQGKEAPIVFLVLGADEKSKGAANWAMGTENPNIMNVAATRAKEEFYVIGSRKLYQNLDSDVINITCRILE